MRLFYSSFRGNSWNKGKLVGLLTIPHYISETMNTQGLSGINFAEPDDHDLQQSSLSGLFKTRPTHTTFIDGYWEREVAFIMWPALILKGVWSIIFFGCVRDRFFLGG